jgi:tetratricopeptide (TPR) repeat protein
MRAVVFLSGALAATLFLSGCSGVSERVSQEFTPSTANDPGGAFSTYLSARFAQSDHDLKSAARYYGETLKKDPGNSSLLELSFFYAATSGDFAATAAYAEKVAAATPDDRSARLALAVIALKKKDYAAARQHMAQSAKGPFTTLTVSLFDSWAAAAMGDKAAVEKDLQALAAEKGAESVTAFHMGLLAEFSGNLEAAESAYKQALRGTATPRVLEAYGRMLERAGRGAEAATLYHGYEGQGGFLPVVEPGLERIASRARPEALVSTPAEGVAEALFGLAASLTDASSADVSVLYLRMALYLRPDFALGQILLGDRFDQLRKYDDAIAAYRAVEANSPYRRMAVMALSLDQTRMERPDAAIVELKRLVAVDPKDSEAWIALGDAYRATDKDAPALEAFDRAIEALGTPSARDWRVFYARANVKDKLKDWKGAEADVNLALKLAPNEAQLLNYLGYSWVERGERIPEALAMLERARALRPYDGFIMDSVGWAYYKLGRYDDAARTLGQAVLMVPGDPTVNDHLGDALWKAGQPIAARFQWNHALTFGAEAEAKAQIEQKLKSGLSS